jgi:hypothetical protein
MATTAARVEIRAAVTVASTDIWDAPKLRCPQRRPRDRIRPNDPADCPQRIPRSCGSAFPSLCRQPVPTSRESVISDNRVACAGAAKWQHCGELRLRTVAWTPGNWQTPKKRTTLAGWPLRLPPEPVDGGGGTGLQLWVTSIVWRCYRDIALHRPLLRHGCQVILHCRTCAAPAHPNVVYAIASDASLA